jgi:hypothetical protein
MRARRGIIASALMGAAAAGAKLPELRTSQATSSAEEQSVKGLVFLTREGCANSCIMRANLGEALKALGLASDYQFIDSDLLADSDVRRGYPTPTLLYSNRDVFEMAEPSHSPPTRRIYPGPVPSSPTIRERLKSFGLAKTG